MPTAPTAGNVLIACITVSATLHPADYSVASIVQTGVTWTKAVGLDDATNGVTAEIWYGVVGAGASATVTVTLTTPLPVDGSAVVNIKEQSGIITTSPVDKTATHVYDNTGDTATNSGTTAATTSAQEYVVACIGTHSWVNQVGLANPNGFALTDGVAHFGGAGYCSCAMLEQNVNTTGTQTCGTNASGSDYWGCIATFLLGDVVTKNLTITSTANCTPTPAAGVHAYGAGTSATVSVVAASGYHHEGWTYDGGTTTVQQGINPVIIIMNNDVTVAPVISANATYSVIIASGAGGSTNPAADTYTVDEGSSYTITASPNSGKRLDHWILQVTGESAENWPSNGNVIVFAVGNANVTVTPVFADVFATSKAWQFAYWDGSTRTLLSDAAFQSSTEEITGYDQYIFNIPNTTTNRGLLNFDDKDAENVPVEVLYNGVHVYDGLAVAAQYTSAMLQVTLMNPLMTKLKQATALITQTYTSHSAGGIAALILYSAGITDVLVNCPTEVFVSITYTNSTVYDALMELAKAANLYMSGSGNAYNSLMLNLTDRAGSTYTPTLLESTSRSIDRSKKYGQVVVYGHDNVTGAVIQGSAGTSGAVKSYVYNKYSDVATLNNLAAGILPNINNSSAKVPLAVLTDTCALYHPGDLITVNRTDLCLVGTFTIMRISKQSTVSTAEVEIMTSELSDEILGVSSSTSDLANNTL